MTTTVPDVADAFPAGAWAFTPAVVDEFDTHVRQSVPFYDTIQDTVAALADWLAPEGSVVADLGVSTAETFARIRKRHPNRRHRFVGYDTSAAMLDAAEAKVPGMNRRQNGIEKHLFHEDAALTISLFTLQFLSLEDRRRALRNARNAAAAGGAILVAEKVREQDARWFEIGAERSWDFKADAGIGDSSIRAKARSLRGVLQSITLEENLALLSDAGWSAPTCLFRWHQWALFGAFADGSSR